ncbi:MAG: tRNA (adenosine(37)-N6)-threonylcarbamoyltransferase complex dimerization subunit type 1 TsaB [Microbacterium sp.]
MILGIDTSLGTAVAVVEADGLVRAEASSDDPLGHAEAIGGLLQAVIADAAFGPIGSAVPPERVELTYVASGMGPGPFTGLRVGIAAARAFALGRGIPVLPVASHDAVALGILLEEAMTDAASPRFAVVTDARRKEFAYTVYEGVDDDGLPVRVTDPALVPRDELDAVLADLGAERRDAASVPAAMIALVAARALAAGRESGPRDALYLRSPDVTMPGAPKRVSA